MKRLWKNDPDGKGLLKRREEKMKLNFSKKDYSNEESSTIYINIYE